MSHSPDTARSERPSWRLWPLALIAVLLVILPWIVSKFTISEDSVPPQDARSVHAARVMGNFQLTMFVIIVASCLVYFWRFIPLWWSLCRASLAGLVIAIEVLIVFWLVYGGLAGFGMPGIFWHQDAATVFVAAYWVTMFTFWMLYLLFVSDFEVNRHEPEDQVWTRFRGALLAGGLPRTLRDRVEQVDAIGQLRWFWVSPGPPLVLLVLPGILPAVRPAGPQHIIEWSWLGGLAAGAATVAFLVWARAATRLHEAWRAVTRRSTFRSVIFLDSGRLDPHANVKNILIIVVGLYVLTYLVTNTLDPVRYHLVSHVPAAFSICILLGVIATATTWFVTRSRLVRWSLVIGVVLLVSLVGALDYEVEIRELAGRYPSAREQFARHLSPEDSIPASYRAARGRGSKQYQKKALTAADWKDAWVERQRRLDRWRRSFADPAGAAVHEEKPILVVVTTSGGALRAAAWTEAVLRHLNTALGSDFPRHVRLITAHREGCSARRDSSRRRSRTARCRATSCSPLPITCVISPGRSPSATSAEFAPAPRDVQSGRRPRRRLGGSG